MRCTMCSNQVVVHCRLPRSRSPVSPIPSCGQVPDPKECESEIRAGSVSSVRNERRRVSDNEDLSKCPDSTKSLGVV